MEKDRNLQISDKIWDPTLYRMFLTTIVFNYYKKKMSGCAYIVHVVLQKTFACYWGPCL